MRLLTVLGLVGSASVLLFVLTAGMSSAADEGIYIPSTWDDLFELFFNEWFILLFFGGTFFLAWSVRYQLKKWGRN
ncbi:MAG: hypothetical protein LBJ20_00890 [Candidatus Methanoplasma sp.]|jgi:hypothetical protein|nr:hypothetical protein [Candidatus Methanoplasma sp.]